MIAGADLAARRLLQLCHVHGVRNAAQRHVAVECRHLDPRAFGEPGQGVVRVFEIRCQSHARFLALRERLGQELSHHQGMEHSRAEGIFS